MTNSKAENIEKDFVEFKYCFSIKQYTKSKPTKCGFKFWLKCDSITGYLYDLNICCKEKTIS